MTHTHVQVPTLYRGKSANIYSYVHIHTPEGVHVDTHTCRNSHYIEAKTLLYTHVYTFARSHIDLHTHVQVPTIHRDKSAAVYSYVHPHIFVRVISTYTHVKVPAIHRGKSAIAKGKRRAGNLRTTSAISRSSAAHHG